MALVPKLPGRDHGVVVARLERSPPGNPGAIDISRSTPAATFPPGGSGAVAATM